MRNLAALLLLACTAAALVPGCTSPGHAAPPATPSIVPAAPPPATNSTRNLPLSLNFTGGQLGAGADIPGLPPPFVPGCQALGSLPRLDQFGLPAGAHTMTFDLSWNKPMHDLAIRITPPGQAGTGYHDDVAALQSGHQRVVLKDPAAGQWGVMVCAIGAAANVDYVLAITAS